MWNGVMRNLHPMPKGRENSTPWDVESEAMEIILRHRPDLLGKTFEEARAILKAEFPGKGGYAVTRRKNGTASPDGTARRGQYL